MSPRKDDKEGGPIGDYGLLSDCHSAALVRRNGSIDWLCMPRFDAPSIFGRLLDPAAGHWSLRPADPAGSVARRYRPHTLVHEIRFASPGGVATLTDALVLGRIDNGHMLGHGSPHILVRQVQGDEGRTEFHSELAARPEYGFSHTILSDEDGFLVARGGGVELGLSSPFDHSFDGTTATGRFSVAKGETVRFALQFSTAIDDLPARLTQDEIGAHLQQTIHAWELWCQAHSTYRGPWRDLVEQSAKVLQGLSYYPTGAMVAAPTTSLPERVGGVRNWDYRYSWIRDTAHTLDAIGIAACPEEADKLFGFLVHSAATRMHRDGTIQIMFGIRGEHILTELELTHLKGWRDSRPVRIGNAAALQRQLDVYGELLDAAFVLRDHLDTFDPLMRDLLVRCADTAASLWTEKDEGIWEMRGRPRHFVYSKLMCWVALDRAIQLVDLLGADDRLEDWHTEREKIREAILTDGWDDKVGAFRQAFDEESLDASNLLTPVVGFLSPHDPRVLGNLEATVRHLTDPHGLVYRYRTDDGLPGSEGSFLPCTFWLAEAYARSGFREEARSCFERAAGKANELGLLSEEYDAERGEAIGNFPQALSHIGLIQAALAIQELEEGKEPERPESRRTARGS